MFTPKLKENRDKRIKFNHDTEIININDKEIEVDKNIVPLIKELNRVGLKTLWSCEGTINGEDWNDKAYITFDISNIKFSVDNKQLTIRWKHDNK